MQSNWPSLPNWVFSKVVESSSESGQIWSSSSSCSPGPGASSGPQCGNVPSSAKTSSYGQLSTPISHFTFTPSAGKAAIGGGLAAVLQAAGGLLRFLGRGGSSKIERKRRAGQGKSKKDVISIRAGPEALKFSGASKIYRDHMESAVASPGATSLLLNRVTSLLLENFSKIRSRNALPTALAAMLPPLTNTPSNFLPFTSAEELESEKPCMIENFEETMRPREKVSRRQLQDTVIVEPKTGVRFPVHLDAVTGDEDSSNQQLWGFSGKSAVIIILRTKKLFNDPDVQPEQLRKKIGEKYAGVPPEELKYRPEFYDDLLSQGVDMTIRLVVHYKGLKMGMVRSAFETSLKSRLKKIPGSENDNGLNSFLSIMSEDVIIFRGTTIDFRWQPGGGALQTEIGGQRVGTIFSSHLCRAFFDMYIGDPPVSEPAKLAIGESFARLLSTCPTA